MLKVILYRCLLLCLVFTNLTFAESQSVAEDFRKVTPLTIKQCDTIAGHQNCSVWTSDGKGGFNARWADGSVAHIATVRFDDADVEFLRQDILTRKTQMTYSAHRSGDEIKDGILSFKLFGHEINGTWTASMVYPPGITATNKSLTARLPTPASTNQLNELRSEAIRQAQEPNAFARPSATPANEVAPEQGACSPLVSAEYCAKTQAASAAENKRRQDAITNFIGQMPAPHQPASSAPIRQGFSVLTVLSKPEAIVPENLRSTLIQAVANVALEIGKDGLVKTATFIDWYKRPYTYDKADQKPIDASTLNKIAEDVAKRYVFKPFQVNGSAIEISTTTHIFFKLASLPSDPEGFPVAAPNEIGKGFEHGLPRNIYLCNPACVMWTLDLTNQDYWAKDSTGGKVSLSVHAIGGDRVELAQEGFPNTFCKGRFAVDGNIYGFLTWKPPHDNIASFAEGACIAKPTY